MNVDTSPGEYQPCPLQFYDFRQLDHKLHCPLYSTILEHPDNGVSLDDLNTMQSELLAMQTNVQNRIHLLESELSVLNEWQVKRDYRKRKHSDTSDSGHSRSRRTSDSQPPKRQKLDLDHRRSKQHRTPEGLEEYRTTSEHTTISRLKGDAPDRFWASVEPYCADITEMEIKLLQEPESDDDSEILYHIPPLGQHYSQRWAVEDLQEERRESLRLLQIAEPGSMNSGDGLEESESLLKQVEGEERPQYGPLTQRLIAAFLEDPSGKVGVSRPHGRRFSPPLNVPQVDVLEKRIKEELIALGVFERTEAKTDTSEDDEILAELQRKQAELRAVSEYNSSQCQTLLSVARAEMKRQDIKRQIQQVDSEVMEWLRRFSAYRQKKKGISRKEREAAWKALEQRESLCLKLRSLN